MKNVKTLRISDKTHSEFTKIMAELWVASGKRKNQDETLDALIRKWRGKK
jgi:hypothetical protein